MASSRITPTTFDTFMSELEPSMREAFVRASTLTCEKFARRADDYDQRAAFPRENFQDLHEDGLLAATIPLEFGGLGITPYCGQTFSSFMLTKLLAKADLSLGRCWEGHINALVLINALGNREQRERWFGGVINQGDVWVVWSGEPRNTKPGEAQPYGTTVVPVDGGWIIDGTKVFCTSATGAAWAIVMVNLEGPGGARHAEGSTESLLMLACSLHDPTITVDTSWWDPIGMRATVSHLVRFNNTFVPSDRLIGAPGSFFRDQWASAFVAHYAASFLGAAESAYDYGLAYIKQQGKSRDAYVQQRVGSMAVNLETAQLWLHHVASLWDQGYSTEASQAGSRARHLIGHLAEQTVQHCIRICGARSLNRPSRLERTVRDLTFYCRHDNDDHILATIGRVALDEPHDSSFHRL